MDILGQAISDYFHNETTNQLWINTSYGQPEEMPVEVFFRSEEEMPDLEIIALNNCRGKVLDIGAGAGSHSLLLQTNKFDVTALEISPLACRVIEQRGVRKVINEDIFLYGKERFDTILLLMNGIGLCGDVDGLKKLLLHLKTILNPGGQILFDSSDISYLYEDGTPKPSSYYGEVKFQYTYKTNNGEWFDWLYIDQNTLKAIAKRLNFQWKFIYEDENDQYLVKLQ